MPSNKINVTFIVILPFYLSTWYICDFLLFHIEIEEKLLVDYWAGGDVSPPLKLIGGPSPLAPPLPTPMSQYIIIFFTNTNEVKGSYHDDC